MTGGPDPDRFERVAGVVVAFDEQEGLGRVAAARAAWPFHCTRIADGTRTVPVDTEVTFLVAPGPYGWEATDLRPR